MCCPMIYYKRRIQEFKEHPNMIIAYLKAGKKYLESHPDTKASQDNSDVYEYFYRHVCVKTDKKFRMDRDNMFGKPNYKELLEQIFEMKFNI